MMTQMIVRIEPELKVKASRLAQAEGANLSEVVRRLLEAYVKERDVEGYIDELWDRIGNDLKASGVGPENIENAISQVRAES